MRSILARWKSTSEEIRPNIFIPPEEADPLFNREVKILIEKIEANVIGNRLLEKIGLHPPAIHIFYGKEDRCTLVRAKEKTIPLTIIECSMKDTRCFSAKGESIPLPKHVILFHELTQGYHHLSGKSATSNFSDPLVWGSDEEYKTIVGFPSKKGKTTPKITENAFRFAEGLPERFGSVDPIANGSNLFLISRIKLLGKIHEQNRFSLSPPSIALYSISDLRITKRCALYAEIQGVDTDFALKNTTSRFLSIDPSNSIDSLMGDRCYLRLLPEADMTIDTIKRIARDFLPKLQRGEFEVKFAVFLRLSEDELASIPRSYL
jgi:hypothetical protein